MVEKQGQKIPFSGNARKKTFFLREGFPKPCPPFPLVAMWEIHLNFSIELGHFNHTHPIYVCMPHQSSVVNILEFVEYSEKIRC